MIRFILDHAILWLCLAMACIGLLMVLLAITIGDADTGDGHCRYAVVAISALVGFTVFFSAFVAGFLHAAWIALTHAA